MQLHCNFVFKFVVNFVKFVKFVLNLLIKSLLTFERPRPLQLDSPAAADKF